MNLELNEVQAEALTRELHSIIQNDRYPLSLTIPQPSSGMTYLHRQDGGFPIVPGWRYGEAQVGWATHDSRPGVRERGKSTDPQMHLVRGDRT